MVAEKKNTTKAKTTAKTSFAIDLKEDKAEVADRAIRNKKMMKSLMDGLAGDNRRVRQYAASVINIIGASKIEALKPYSAELADALHRPEAQTRWEILEVLTNLVSLDARLVDKALAGAEASLYDEDSGVVRLEALRLMCVYGATTEARSTKVWPFIDEAIQCYHGDPEFPAMLTAVLEFIQGNTTKEVRKAAAARMKFDAENSKGALQRRSKQIVAESRKRR